MSDEFPTAAELYAEGALSNRMPTAAELLAATDSEGPDFEGVSMVDMDEEGGVPERGTAANLTLIPTSTTNPDRPRTLAAGYEKKLKTLTVMFRDSTLYNYYDVEPLVWSNFKRARSKGRFILAYLDGHERGYPTGTDLSEFGQDFFANVAREYQQAQGGLQPGHSARSKRGMRPYRG